MSKFFKGLKKAKAKVDAAPPPEPREIEAITKEYNDLKALAGEVQYQIFALTSNLAQMNNNLLSLNHEGAARQKLDRENAETAKKVVEELKK